MHTYLAPAFAHLLVVSGRADFYKVQKMCSGKALIRVAFYLHTSVVIPSSNFVWTFSFESSLNSKVEVAVGLCPEWTLTNVLLHLFSFIF